VVLAPGSGKPQCSGQHKPAPHFTGCVGPAQTAKAHLTTDWSPDNQVLLLLLLLLVALLPLLPLVLVLPLVLTEALSQIWGSKDPQCVCDKDVKTRLRYCKVSTTTRRCFHRRC